MTYLLDTGPLVGLLDRNDPWHAWCVETLQHLSPPFHTCEAVLAEASHFFERMDAVCTLLDSGEVSLNFDAKDEMDRLCQLMGKYEQMSFADASIVRMAEIQRGSIVWTLDRRDFSRYRIRRNEPVPFLAPEP